MQIKIKHSLAIILVSVVLCSCTGFIPKKEPVYMTDWDNATRILTLGANNGWPQKTEVDMGQAALKARSVCHQFGYKSATLVMGEYNHCRLNLGGCVLSSQNVRYRCEP